MAGFENYRTLVIYDNQMSVLGFLEHESGDRASEKAEAVTGQKLCLWDRWENATQEPQEAARKLGAIT